MLKNFFNRGHADPAPNTTPAPLHYDRYPYTPPPDEAIPTLEIATRLRRMETRMVKLMRHLGLDAQGDPLPPDHN